MKFLLPVGGVVDHRFGILTSPAHKGIPLGIREGMEWGADNGVYSGAFDAGTYPDWLETMQPYADTCLFVLAPDVVGDAEATRKKFRRWSWRIRGLGFPVAYAAQDGQRDCVVMKRCGLPWGFEYDALFIGGTTAWKLGTGALWCIQEAQEQDKHIHIGRVNNWKRYEYFRGLDGSDEWTCDGTKTRFIGTEAAVELWAGYQKRAYNLRLPSGNRGGQLADRVARSVGDTD
jgi:hypothetical protein